MNVLEPHPDLPIIATSGLDHQVKIWTPHGDPNDEGKLSQLKSVGLGQLKYSKNIFEKLLMLHCIFILRSPGSVRR